MSEKQNVPNNEAPSDAEDKTDSSEASEKMDVEVAPIIEHPNAEAIESSSFGAHSRPLSQMSSNSATVVRALDSNDVRSHSADARITQNDLSYGQRLLAAHQAFNESLASSSPSVSQSNGSAFTLVTPGPSNEVNDD